LLASCGDEKIFGFDCSPTETSAAKIRNASQAIKSIKKNSPNRSDFTNFPEVLVYDLHNHSPHQKSSGNASTAHDASSKLEINALFATKQTWAAPPVRLRLNI